MADESTRGVKENISLAYWNITKGEPILTILRMKDLDRCESANVSISVLESIESFNLNPNHYLYNDNTK